MSTANAIDQFSWTVQTRLRQIGESLEWRFLQWTQQLPNPEPGHWNWLVPALVWTLRGLGLLTVVFLLYLFMRLLKSWVTQALGQLAAPRASQSAAAPSGLDWLALMRSAQAQQDYRQAFQALYMAMLLRFHESGVMRQDRARTDRESIRLLDRLWSLSDQPIGVRDDWVMLFETHESLCFGGGELPRDRFLQCRAAYDQLVPYLKR